ncbi:hypothetical protein [cyanobacterium endosymbiont of Epithemia turgida]|nr:hypothetical protein [cyanobacterium endosymbiont of Epithemia turgida]BAP18043.1 hypothetical protein ETSB_1290 [cyanobacterium endosymbiont of Epithemia turgida isolate EtSB Lake Yunoko]
MESAYPWEIKANFQWGVIVATQLVRPNRCNLYHTTQKSIT